MSEIHDIINHIMALEADDITNEVDDQKKDLLGGNASGVDGPANTELEDQMDELEDTAGSDGRNIDEPEDDNEGEDTTDDTPPEDDTTSDEPPVDDNSIEEPKEDNKTPAYLDRSKIRDNLIHIHGILTNEIDRFSDALSNTNSANTIDVLNRVIENFRNTRAVAYNVITKEITDGDLPTLLERYIGIRRIYEINIDIVKQYFDILEKDKEKNKKRED